MPRKHTVRQGECLSSIAYHYKLASWEVIYNHPQNANFKTRRPNPNIIFQGDELYIPDITERTAKVPVDRRNIFVAKVAPTYLNVRIENMAGDPIANAPYELKLDALTLTGNSNNQGWIHSRIPAWAEFGRLTVWPNPQDRKNVIVWNARLGHLDPLETVTGIKGRLHNLGYDCGEIDDTEDEQYEQAVCRFQRDHGLKVDGIPGPRTLEALTKAHRV